MEKSTPNNVKIPKLIHAAVIQKRGKGIIHLFLRKLDAHHYCWFEGSNDGQEEVETTVSGENVEEAIRLAIRHWAEDGFRTIKCGFRYTLPERDEHGINALFYQMTASYASPNGIYFDEDLGNNCFVNFASVEARDLFNILKQQNRL